MDGNSVKSIVVWVIPLVREDRPPGYQSWRLLEQLTNGTAWEVGKIKLRCQSLGRG